MKDERKHWNKIGSSYHSEIFDVFSSDRLRKIPSIIRHYANPDHTAIDFGCGTGRAFKFLSPSFKTVLGIDISDSLLEIASTAKYKNISLKHHDLTKSLKAKANFGFSCNVVMLPDPDQNRKMLKNIRQSIVKGGNVVIVIPSIESFLWSGWRRIDWHRRERTNPGDIDPSEFSGFKVSKTDLIQGIVKIDGVKTKHFSQPEIEVLFRECGFITTRIEKLEYDWTSEFAEPPKWMKEPYPWDWIVEAN